MTRIDSAVAILGKANNGLYTNEWLLADIKTNEIAMFELGTTKTKLYRSSKNEWLGGTEGFYWGCNNARDLNVRLDTQASVQGSRKISPRTARTSRASSPRPTTPRSPRRASPLSAHRPRQSN